ncbi:MAG: holo-ACP synthase [Chloroflexi bacterium]|nr:holo-ACP synthase [Chloroflexota bacterium]
MSGEAIGWRQQNLECGVDIVEIARVEDALQRWGERFLCRVFTRQERLRYGDRAPELAARFAAKEAVSKALGTGLRGISWREIETLGDERGKPVLTLHGKAARRARELGLCCWSVSLSHSRDNAIAFVVASGE